MLMLKNYLILSVLFFVCACQNGGTVGTPGAETEPRIVNPEIAKRIEVKRTSSPAAGFPRFSDMPKEIPEMQNRKETKRYENDLLALRATMNAGLAIDLRQTALDRKISANIVEDGRIISLSLEEAAKTLQRRMASDQVRVRALMKKPMPLLGGRPPKNLR